MAREGPLGERVGRPALGLQGRSEGLRERPLDLLRGEATRLGIARFTYGLLAQIIL